MAVNKTRAKNAKHDILKLLLLRPQSVSQQKQALDLSMPMIERERAAASKTMRPCSQGLKIVLCLCELLAAQSFNLFGELKIFRVSSFR
jgi:hypothetical protein